MINTVTFNRLPFDSPNRVMENAREKLGHMWGFGRPLYAAELGRALGLASRDPGQAVRNWETGETVMPGPAVTALQMMLRGQLPPTPLNSIRERK